MNVNGELMSSNPIVVDAATPIGVCARRMIQHRIRHLPVVVEDGHAIGVITDVSVFRYGSLVGSELELWAAFDPEGEHLVAGDLLDPIEIKVGRDDALIATLRRLTHSTQDFVAVVDGEQLIGILTEHDGVRLAAGVLHNSGLTVRVESSSPIYLAEVTDPAFDVLERMDAKGFRHMAVVDFGELRGVLSRGDLIADSVSKEQHLLARDVVRGTVVHSIREFEPLEAAAATMMEHHIGCLPVIDELGRPHRIVTRTDLIEAAIVALEQSAVFPAATTE